MVQFPQLIEFTFQTLKRNILARNACIIKQKANMEDGEKLGAGEDEGLENKNLAESNMDTDETLTPG